MSEIQIFFEPGKAFIEQNIKPLNGLVGLYFIYNTEMSIQYPFQKSKLIYIGMSEKKTNSMGKRLLSHLDGSSKNEGIASYSKSNPLLFTHINFEMLKNNWPLNIESLESFFILNFVEKYGVYPICNNKSGYNIREAQLKIDFRIDWENFH